MSLSPSLSVAAVFIVLLSFSISSAAATQTASQTVASASSSSDAASAQSVPGQTEKIPQPGELGSPFPVNHIWNHFALELSGGYSPVTQKGAGYFNKGFNVTCGVIGHISPHWTLMAEANIFGLHGRMPVDTGTAELAENYSNTVFAPGFAAAFDLLSHARTSPYVIGGIGYYVFGPVTMTGDVSNLTAIDAANSVGYNGGIGIRHRLYYGKRMEIFADGRYHYVASRSTNFGQISLLPISAGIRW